MRIIVGVGLIGCGVILLFGICFMIVNKTVKFEPFGMVLAIIVPIGLGIFILTFPHEMN